MVLADDIESFWLSGPCLRASESATAASSQLERAYSQESLALSHAASIGPSVSRNHSIAEGTAAPDSTLHCWLLAQPVH